MHEISTITYSVPDLKIGKRGPKGQGGGGIGLRRWGM